MPTPKKRTLLKKLFLFEAVARNGSHTRAAKELGVTQPNVSIQLRQLEEEIGAPLIEQNGKKLSVTAIGEMLYPHCQTIRQELNNAQVCIDRLKGVKQGQISVYIGAAAKYFMPTLIAAFQRATPGIQFNVHVAGPGQMISGLKDNAYDLSIVGGAPQLSGLASTQFFEDPFVLIAAPDHPLVNERNICLSRATQFRFLMREENSETRSFVDTYFSEKDVTCDVAFIANCNEAIKSGVAAGVGLSFVTRQSVLREVAAGQLAVLDTACTPPNRQWHLAHLKNKRFSHVAEAFSNFVSQDAARVIRQSNAEVQSRAIGLKGDAS